MMKGKERKMKEKDDEEKEDKPDFVSGSSDVLARPVDGDAGEVKVRLKGKGVDGGSGGAKVPEVEGLTAA